MDLSELKITAELANLDLTDEEFSSLGGEVEKMLVYFSKMRGADVAALLARRKIRTVTNRLRRDEQIEETPPDALLESAPELEDRFIVIPNVL